MNVWFNLAKNSYEKGFPGYDDEGLKVFVVVGWISASEYQQITGIPYKA